MSIKKKILSVGGIFLAGVVVGSTIMYNDSFYRTINDALGKGATQNAIIGTGNVNGIESINVSSMDLETAMMAVQSQRTQQLEQQLQSQLQSVQDRNKEITQINSGLTTMMEIQNEVPVDASSDTALNASQTEVIGKVLEEAGINSSLPANKGELDSAVQQLKNQADSLSNSQQMDMLRLQSLSNKRNEAFDVMTNFIKKMQDSRSSIIGNMR